MAKKFTAGNGYWMLRAECRDADRDLFFVGDTKQGLAYEAQVKEAKEYCGRCAVRLQCLDWAETTRDNNTIMGGMTPDERRAAADKAARRQAPSQ